MFGSFVLSFNLKVSEITTFQGPTPFVFCTSTPLVVVSRHGCDHRHCGKWKEKKEEVFAPQRIRHLRCSTMIYLLFISHIDLIFILQIHFFHNMSRIWGIPIFFRYRPWSRLPWKKLPFVSKREAPWTWMQIMMGKFHPMNSWRTFSEFTFVPMSCWSGCLWKMDCWDLCNRPLAFLKVTGFQEGVRHETWYHVKVLLWY